MAAALRERSRKPAARSQDALIAATGLAHQLAIYTCNAKDFEGVQGLTVHDVVPVRQPPHPRPATDGPPPDQ